MTMSPDARVYPTGRLSMSERTKSETTEFQPEVEVWR